MKAPLFSRLIGVLWFCFFLLIYVLPPNSLICKFAASVNTHLTASVRWSHKEVFYTEMFRFISLRNSSHMFWTNVKQFWSFNIIKKISNHFFSTFFPVSWRNSLPCFFSDLFSIVLAPGMLKDIKLNVSMKWQNRNCWRMWINVLHFEVFFNIVPWTMLPNSSHT